MEVINSFYKIILPACVETKELVDFLLEVDTDFFPPLTSKVNIVEYAEKLRSNAMFCVAREESTSRILGLIAFYCNDAQKINTYIPVIGVNQALRGKGIGGKLLDSVIVYLKEIGFQHVLLETCEGSSAQKFYESRGFNVFNKVQDRPANLCSMKMRKAL